MPFLANVKNAAAGTGVVCPAGVAGAEMEAGGAHRLRRGRPLNPLNVPHETDSALQAASRAIFRALPIKYFTAYSC